jgi:hypothetical protein
MTLNQIIAHGRALSANEVMYSVLKCFEKRILLEDAAVNAKQNSNKHVFSTNDFLYVGVLTYHIPTPIRAPTYPHSSVPVLNKTINNRTDAKNESRKFLFSYCPIRK